MMERKGGMGWKKGKRRMGMSRPSIVFCLVRCDQKIDQDWNGLSGGQAVGVQERSGVVQKECPGVCGGASEAAVDAVMFSYLI